jgi:hypothetical protein
MPVTIVSAANMVTYLVVVRVVSTIAASTVSGEMESRLRTGDIADDLLRPTGFGLLMFGRSLGQMAAGLLNRTLPVAVLAQLIWRLQLPASFSTFLAARGAVAAAVLISYAIAYLLGILGFWVWTTEHAAIPPRAAGQGDAGPAGGASRVARHPPGRRGGNGAAGPHAGLRPGGDAGRRPVAGRAGHRGGRAPVATGRRNHLGGSDPVRMKVRDDAPELNWPLAAQTQTTVTIVGWARRTVLK